MRRVYGRSWVLVAAGFAAALLCRSGHVCAQDAAQPEPLALAVKQANDAAEVRYQEMAKKWRAKLAAWGRKDGFRRLARDVVSLEEKVAKGAAWFGKSATPADRMRVLFRKHIVDDRNLIPLMKKAFADCQDELMKESVTLYAKAGVPRDAVGRVYAVYTPDTTRWSRAFDPVVARAGELAKEDWVRSGAGLVGSAIAADGIVDAGRQTGLLNTEPGSWQDVLGTFVMHLIVEAAVEHATDPTDDVAEKLRSKFSEGERVLLDGDAGLLSSLRKITNLHQQTRRLHFGVNEKGGR